MRSNEPQLADGRYPQIGKYGPIVYELTGHHNDRRLVVLVGGHGRFPMDTFTLARELARRWRRRANLFHRNELFHPQVSYAPTRCVWQISREIG